MEDLNGEFLNYLILLLNMDYKILRMEHNCKKVQLLVFWDRSRYGRHVKIIKGYTFLLNLDFGQVG